MIITPLLIVLGVALGVTLGRSHRNRPRQNTVTGQCERPGPDQVPSVRRPAYLFDPLIATKVAATARNYSANGRLPQYTDRTAGRWQWFNAEGTWTSGFFPAELYEMHKRGKLCGNSPGGTDWLALARQWTELLTPLTMRNSVGHDVGFISFAFSDEMAENPSNQNASQNLIRMANQLAARYDTTVGATRSWDSSGTNFQVIIDNMMNLDLFYKASKITGNNSYIAMAISHADKTLANQIRADGGSFHVVEYDSSNGRVTRRRTAQGYSDNSTWSRGQAWAIYGFAQMYGNQPEQRYLDVTRRVATYFKSRVPASGIVPWDFDAPSGPILADTSAGMIAANGMLLLSQHERSVRNTTGETYWINAAVELMDKTASFGWKPQWESLLSNGTVNNPSNNNLTGTIYGDYYFIKAGNLLRQMGLVECT